jgi:hypothetical protein
VVVTLPRQLSGRQWCATAMQAPGEPKQHFAPAVSAPERLAVLGVGALGDEAVAVAFAHQPAHAGRLADPGYEAHATIVRLRGLRRNRPRDRALVCWPPGAAETRQYQLDRPVEAPDPRSCGPNG